jgi:predicted amino acid racemase
MDMLQTMCRRNLALVRACAELHRERLIPPDTYVADLDVIRANAAVLAQAIKRHSLASYYEAKQFGRNPLVCAALVEAGFESAIALDIEEAEALHATGFKVGHVGHLGQPAVAEVDFVVSEVAPEVVTVYSVEKASELAAAARAAGREQGLLLRVVGRDDLQRDVIGGGTPEEDLIETARRIAQLAGVRLEGVTTYPALRYDIRERRWAPTPNLATMVRARGMLESAGIPIAQVNAAGNSCVSTIGLLADAGATHVEPGQAFAGATPGHFFEDLDELPALAYVSEIAYTSATAAYAFAHGMVANHTIGIWNALMYERLMALVGSEPDGIEERRVWADPPQLVGSDSSSFMYARLHQGRSVTASVGDTVVFGFRTQVYRSNSGRLAVVDGIQKGQPQLLGLFDRTGRPLEPLRG